MSPGQSKRVPPKACRTSSRHCRVGRMLGLGHNRPCREAVPTCKSCQRRLLDKRQSCTQWHNSPSWSATLRNADPQVRISIERRDGRAYQYGETHQPRRLSSVGLCRSVQCMTTRRNLRASRPSVVDDLGYRSKSSPFHVIIWTKSTWLRWLIKSSHRLT